MKAWGSAPSVIAALRDDAGAEIERLAREADAALGRLAAAAVPEGPRDRDSRLASARRAIADLEAEEDWQDTVTAVADRDAWIVAAAEQGRRALAAAGDALEWTARLAAEALQRLPDVECVLWLPASLLPRISDAWRAALERETGKRVTIQGGPFAAGCLARTADGRVSFDNRVEAREAQSLTEWRSALARIYEAAIGETAAVGQ